MGILGEFKTFLTLLNPFAPHITEELNQVMGGNKEISSYSWPVYDINKTIDEKITLAVQLNGKLKLTIEVNRDEEQNVVSQKVHEAMQDRLIGKNIIKEIYVRNRVYNIVVK